MKGALPVSTSPTPSGMMLGFPGRLRDLRRRAGLTQQQVGAAVGLTRASISNMELGNQWPELLRMLELCRALGVDPNTLLGWKR